VEFNENFELTPVMTATYYHFTAQHLRGKSFGVLCSLVFFICLGVGKDLERKGMFFSAPHVLRRDKGLCSVSPCL
jgi:hypothetical protein